MGATNLAGRRLGVPGVLLAVLVVHEAALSRGLHSGGNAREIGWKRKPPEGTPRLCGPRSAQGTPRAASLGGAASLPPAWAVPWLETRQAKKIVRGRLGALTWRVMVRLALRAQEAWNLWEQRGAEHCKQSKEN